MAKNNKVEVAFVIHEGQVVGVATWNRETKEYIYRYVTGDSRLEYQSNRCENRWDFKGLTGFFASGDAVIYMK